MMPIPNRDAVALSARTLGALFSYAPNSAEIAPLVAAFQDGSWQQQWPFPVAAPLASGFAASAEETLPEAWQRLFIGPWALPAPPWGSVWLDKESVLFGDSTLALRQWMRENGIALEADGNEPEDHFGTVLLLAALAASLFARRFTPQSEWKLWVACGAAAGMASAYHAPLAGSLFIAEILFGTLMLASLGPVVISAVIALLLTQFLNGGAAPLYHVVLQQNLSALHYGLMLATGLLAGLCGPLFIWLMDYSHRGFVKLKLAPPWQLALGGLIVGGLSLITPAVWGNGYSVVQSYLLLPPSGALLVGVFICKLLAVLASSGSGAPGGVFTPTLFVGLAMGMLFACFSRLWLPGSEEMAIMMGLTGMAAFLAATTHAPIMSTLMICEMTGQYTLLPGLLITCVVSSVLSRTLRRDSIYRHHVAEHV
ncbi:voltage-gated ClC-type chloride channel ClcB [Klebsiella pneumoniae]